METKSYSIRIMIDPNNDTIVLENFKVLIENT